MCPQGVPISLIRQELEELGMSEEWLDTSSRRVRSILENLSHSKRIDCPSCGRPYLRVVVAETDAVQILARCDCGFSGSFEMEENPVDSTHRFETQVLVDEINRIVGVNENE